VSEEGPTTSDQTPAETNQQSVPEEGSRRTFLSASGVAMTAGLVGGYGTLTYIAGRYLYPTEGERVDWQIVAVVDEVTQGQTIEYEAPNGSKVIVTRQGQSPPGEDPVDDFIALSSVCPHLGCQVHWEPQNDRFFCPCHAGAFDPQGRPIQGPPKIADQHLVRFPLKVEEGLLYIKAPVTTLVQSAPSSGALAAGPRDARSDSQEA